MNKNLYQTLKNIIHHPEEKETLWRLILEQVLSEVKELLEFIIFEEREIFCEEMEDVGNGFYKRDLNLPLGKIKDLKVPRTRFYNFKTSLFEPYQKNAFFLDELITAMYSSGCSKRDISRILENLYGIKYTPQALSRITDAVEKKIEEFRKRPITKWYPILFVDAFFVKVRRDGVVEKEPVYAVLGIAEEGIKEVVAYYLPGGSGESSVIWREVLTELYNRGLKEPLLIVGDNLPGLEEAVALVYPRADFQSCVLHKVRNTLKKVRKRDQSAVAEDLKRIYEAHHEGLWRENFERFKRNWGRVYPEVIRSWERDLDTLMTYLRYPVSLRRYIYTTNPLERFIKEVKRRTKVIEVFPTELSLDKVVYLVVEEMNASYEERMVQNFERYIEELRELRRERYGEKEDKFKTISKKEIIYTQTP